MTEHTRVLVVDDESQNYEGPSNVIIGPELRRTHCQRRGNGARDHEGPVGWVPLRARRLSKAYPYEHFMEFLDTLYSRSSPISV